MVDTLDATLKDPDEAAAVLGLPLLAVIPFVPPRDQRRLAAMRPPDGAHPPEDEGLPQRRRHLPWTRAAAPHSTPEPS